MVRLPMTTASTCPARGGSMWACHAGRPVEVNLKSRAPLAPGWVMKIESMVRFDVNSALMVYAALSMAWAKTALAPARRKPAP